MIEDYFVKDNIIINDAFVKADSVLNRRGYKSKTCSISGGSDSDIMLDLVRKVDTAIYHPTVRYVWFDTGLEYQATKEHLNYLESRYNTKIYREKAKIPIPLAVKKYGQPFCSKYVASQIFALQHNHFEFKDGKYVDLIKEYPKCKSALKWWCNLNKGDRLNISYNKKLKEFLIKYPPKFLISDKCCKCAKKDVAKSFICRFNVDLIMTGVRKSEGGIRSISYKGCYDKVDRDSDRYRPIFWFKQEDKEQYEREYAIQHSRCYTEYGFTRTGCVLCPFGIKDLEYSLYKTELVEPQLYKAATNVFADSIDYTKRYLYFREN